MEKDQRFYDPQTQVLCHFISGHALYTSYHTGYLRFRVYCCSIHNTKQNQPTCPSAGGWIVKICYVDNRIYPVTKKSENYMKWTDPKMCEINVRSTFVCRSQGSWLPCLYVQMQVCIGRETKKGEGHRTCGMKWEERLLGEERGYWLGAVGKDGRKINKTKPVCKIP